MKAISVKDMTISIGDVVMSKYGRARLNYIGRQSFTDWTLIDQTDMFIFGRPIQVEDNCLNDFVISKL